MQILADKEFIKMAIKLVKEAKSSIDISTFKAELAHNPRGLCVAPFWETLFDKSGVSLKVRMLINWNEKRHSVPKTNILVMKKLKAVNADVRMLHNNRCCHSKLIIIDKKILLMGSHNLSTKSCTENFENSIMIEDKKAVQDILNIYDTLFFKAKKY